MTLYHVQLHREMRLTFEGIEAPTPQAAAAIARCRPTADADAIEDCDGENLAALVEVADDETCGQSVTVDFVSERLRKATPDLLALSRRIVQARATGESVSDQLYVTAVLLLSTLQDEPPPGESGVS